MPFSLQNAPWSRLVRFTSVDGRTLYGQPLDPNQDVGKAMQKGEEVQVEVWDLQNPWDVKGVRTGEHVAVGKLLSPISPEECGTIRAIGLNYKAHAAELGFAIPTEPVSFFKPSQALAPPNAPIPIPKVCQNEGMDYEVELAIILGRACRDACPEKAMECVLAYTCANDLTNRTWQEKQGQWCLSKGFDNFCPLGPCLVSSKSLTRPEEITLTTHLNGELMQEGKGSDTIFSIGQIVSFLSQGCTLPAGTVIITGTPPGIGVSKEPKVWLKCGDEVVCAISHGIGSLVNTMKYE